jgi:hypothetical protein
VRVGQQAGTEPDDDEDREQLIADLLGDARDLDALMLEPLVRLEARAGIDFHQAHGARLVLRFGPSTGGDRLGRAVLERDHKFTLHHTPPSRELARAT